MFGLRFSEGPSEEHEVILLEVMGVVVMLVEVVLVTELFADDVGSGGGGVQEDDNFWLKQFWNTST